MSWHGIAVEVAQCVMCYRTAAAQQAERSRVLNSWIVILLVPPILVLGLISLSKAKAVLRGEAVVGIRPTHRIEVAVAEQIMSHPTQTEVFSLCKRPVKTLNRLLSGAEPSQVRWCE